MSEHTPTPWVMAKDFKAILTEGGNFVMYAAARAKCGREGEDYYQCNSATAELILNLKPADGEFIVKAVNNHDRLVAALTMAEDVLSRAPFSTAIWPNGMHPQTGIDQIRDVLNDLIAPLNTQETK